MPHFSRLGGVRLLKRCFEEIALVPFVRFFARPEIIGRRPLVYPLHMARTNIDIDEALVARVMRRYGLKTKRAAVDLALRRLDVEPMSREEMLALQGSGWEGDLDEMRRGWHVPSL